MANVISTITTNGQPTITSNKSPKLYDLTPVIAAGIDPKSGKRASSIDPQLLNNYKKLFRINDEQLAIHRYVWYNLPNGITSEMIERMLYYKGQIMIFYDSSIEKFIALPFTPVGELDIYGRFNKATPIAFGPNSSEPSKKIQMYLGDIKKDIMYDVVPEDEWSVDHVMNDCVILYDYARQISQTIIPRQQLNETLIENMSEILTFLRTNMLNNTGVSGLRVFDDSEDYSVQLANNAVYEAAINGKKWIPIKGNGQDFQELSQKNSTTPISEHLMALQSLNNLQLSLYGIENGGLFEKNSHLLEKEASINQSPVNLVMQDGLNNRQLMCNIFNSIFKWDLWCEINESIVHTDFNLDGKIDDNSDEMERDLNV